MHYIFLLFFVFFNIYIFSFSNSGIIVFTLHPQVIYWGAIFLLGLDVVNATHSTAQDHREDHGQDFDQDDGSHHTQDLIAVAVD